MTIKIQWDNPQKTIIRQTFYGRWTAEEYVMSVLHMYDNMKTVTHRVHIIVDMTATEGVSPRMMAAARRFDAVLPTNRGLTVGINIPRYLVTIVKVATRLYPRLGRNVHFVSVLEEAYKVIHKHGDRVR